MCQLLGMNCNVPTDVVFSFEGFRRRGGLTDHHADGWGIGFFEDDAWRVFLDCLPSATSPVARLIRDYPIKSRNVIAHIRKATQGRISLANTHPFSRELWGREWVFAHNGNLESVPAIIGGRFQTLGQTDSEQAFCWILNQISLRFDAEPAPENLFDTLRELAATLSQGGSFNFLLGLQNRLFVHCSTQLCYIVRQAPFAIAHLADADLSVDFSLLAAPGDQVALITTEPLTDNEAWIAFQPGNLAWFENGACVRLESVVAPTR